MSSYFLNRIKIILFVLLLLFLNACTIPFYGQIGKSSYNYPDVEYGTIAHINVKSLQKKKRDRKWYDLSFFNRDKFKYTIEIYTESGRRYIGTFVNNKAPMGLRTGDMVRFIKDGREIEDIKVIDRPIYNSF